MISKAIPALLPDLKILLVEDDIIAQQVCTTFLKELGYRIDVAGNGQTALQMIAAHQYNLLLLDIGLPDIDGYTVAATVRQNEAEKNQHMHIVAITAHVLDSDKAACFAAGINDFINKPILKASLKRVLLDYSINR